MVPTDILSESVLRECAAGIAVASLWTIAPTANAVRAVLEPALAAADPHLTAEFGIYSTPCPYASFTDAFVSRPSDRLGSDVDEDVTGLWIFLSLLAPVAAFGTGRVFRSPNRSGWTGLDSRTIGSHPPTWTDLELGAVLSALAQAGFIVLSAGEARRRLTFNAKIETNIGQSPFTVFDAFFHWTD
jgi:hypothetical protein